MTDKRDGPYRAEPFGKFSCFVKGPFPAGKIIPVLNKEETNIAVEMSNMAYAVGFKDGLEMAAWTVERMNEPPQKPNWWEYSKAIRALPLGEE